MGQTYSLLAPRPSLYAAQIAFDFIPAFLLIFISVALIHTLTPNALH